MLLTQLYEASGLSSKPVYRALTDWVVLKILEGVRKGDLVPDQRLSEEDLAQRFDVSRAPVRDALRIQDCTFQCGCRIVHLGTGSRNGAQEAANKSGTPHS